MDKNATQQRTDTRLAGLQVYRVGGAVRDALLGWPVVDNDWVVVGATPEAMRKRGFKPVGRDFPVFLHPDTAEEYALARTERKSGRAALAGTIRWLAEARAGRRAAGARLSPGA